MKRKGILICIGLSCVLLAGCANEASGETQEVNNRDAEVQVEVLTEKTGATEECSQNTELPETEEIKEYYKLSVEDARIDIGKVLKDLSGEAEFAEEELELKGTREINGIQHKWMVEKCGFGYITDRPAGNVDKEKAQAIAVDVVERMNFGKTNNMVVRANIVEGGYCDVQMEFAQEYKGVGITSTGGGSSSEEDCGLRGPYITMLVSEDGIAVAWLFGLMQVEGEIEQYRYSDFIGEQELSDACENYYRTFYSEMGTDTELIMKIESKEIVYMPYLENEQRVLIPVFDVRMEQQVNGDTIESKMLVDALTGYVYHEEWQDV